MYRRLEVPPEASPEQIGRAYRRLAHGVHPDAHPDDPDASRRFREITEAYEILGDPARRERYDRLRQPLARDHPQSAGAAADHNTNPPRRAPSSGQTVASPPVVIGLGPLPTGSAPLIAGPVHIASPSNPRGVWEVPISSSDLAQLVAALLRPGRWW
jgi:curved DNA-binding protein CbpA